MLRGLGCGLTPGHSPPRSDGQYLGPIVRHTADASTVGLWQLDGNVNDTSGNAFNLSTLAGTVRYTDIWPGARGLLLDGATRIGRTIHDNALALTGDYTISCLLRFIKFTTGALVSYDAVPNGNSNTNILYSIGFNNNVFVIYHRASSGPVLDIASVFPLCPPRRLCALTVTRASNVARVYTNGRKVAEGAVVTAPTDGSTCKFTIGFATADPAPMCVLSSLRVNNTAKSDAQVKADYNSTLGATFGMLP